MKIIGQDNEGRLILDLEGEKFNLSLSLNGGSPVLLMNGLFSNSDTGPSASLNGIHIQNGVLIQNEVYISENINEYQKLEIIDPRNHNFNKPSEPIKEQRPVKRWQILDLRG